MAKELKSSRLENKLADGSSSKLWNGPADESDTKENSESRGDSGVAGDGFMDPKGLCREMEWDEELLENS